MKKLLVVLAATGLATALTPAVAETGYDVWAAQSRAASPSQTASGGQTAAGKQVTLRDLLEPNGPLAQ